MHKSPIIRIMEDAVLKTGRSLTRDFGEVEKLQVSRKGPGDFVTSADRRAEKILVQELQKVRPDYGFLVEESGEIAGADKEYRWIADPLDGTTNFMHGIPHFCTSLALEKTQPNGKKEIVAAVIFAPVLNELYWAEKGVGAYMNNERIAVSSRRNLEDALLGAYFWCNGGDRTEADITAFTSLKSNVRILGAAALELAYVAAGKLDGFWNDRLNPWDMAAGILLIQEARGMVTEINGSNRMLENSNILATNGELHDTIRKAIASCYRKV